MNKRRRRYAKQRKRAKKSATRWLDRRGLKLGKKAIWDGTITHSQGVMFYVGSDGEDAR